MDDPKPRAAVLLVHGIGEQRPYETLDAFARGLARGRDVRLTPLNFARPGGVGTLLRIEGLGAFAHLDVVEFHWAGFAQGRIGAPAVLGWIVRTGVAPLNFAHQLPIVRGDERVAMAALRETAQVLALLAAASFAIAAMLWLASLVPTAFRFGWALLATFDLGRLVVLAVAGAFLLSAAAIGLGIGRGFATAASIGRRHGGAWHGLSYARLRGMTPALAALASALLAGGAAVVAIAHEPLAAWARDVLALADRHGGGRVLLAVVVTAAGWIATRWITDYLGDLVLYVTADRRVDRSETRSRVKREVGACLEQLLEGPYERIYLAGHSLGSVIAYDCLNDLVRATRAGSAAVDTSRLRGLLTFGSPLDKVHAFFRERVREDQAVRAQLLSFLHAVRKRPSQRDDGPYRLAPYDVPLGGLRWLNVWSPLDPISDRLRYYDVDVQRMLPAWNPLGAHAAYWRRDVFFAWVVEWLERPD